MRDGNHCYTVRLAVVIGSRFSVISVIDQQARVGYSGLCTLLSENGVVGYDWTKGSVSSLEYNFDKYEFGSTLLDSLWV